ncbi:hypothetical protein [Streptomyces sp. MAR4 CNX-425]|uniref:hypothetical protein n=1 Tax=Streptomyces sp. MAR4 CNX-425 TaxID=3406343 RepID=UPI003B50901A
MAAEPVRPPHAADAPSGHPGLTITVYRVSRTGHRGRASRTTYRPAETEPLPPPEPTASWPPCRCPRCRPG